MVSDDTVRAPRHILLEDTLTSILDALHARPASPSTRELLTEAERYERVVAGWTHRPPPDAQRAAMFECILELHSRVAAGASLPVIPGEPPSAPRTNGTNGRRGAR